jgi:hypothetical protein
MATLTNGEFKEKRPRILFNDILSLEAGENEQSLFIS